MKSKDQKDMIQIKYDEEHMADYGCWRCQECNAEFYGNGKALHSSECTTPGYGNCTYVIGPKTVKSLKAWAVDHGDKMPSPMEPISLSDIRQQLPQLLD